MNRRFSLSPPPLAGLLKPLRYLPPEPIVWLLGRIINQQFREQLNRGELDFLNRRRIGFLAEDIPFGVTIALERKSLELSPYREDAEALIRGPAEIFLHLAARRTDPDTLFFRRKLSLSGDTELGLAVKNFLDTIDWERLPLPIRTGLDWLASTGER